MVYLPCRNLRFYLLIYFRLIIILIIVLVIVVVLHKFILWAMPFRKLLLLVRGRLKSRIWLVIFRRGNLGCPWTLRLAEKLGRLLQIFRWLPRKIIPTSTLRPLRIRRTWTDSSLLDNNLSLLLFLLRIFGVVLGFRKNIFYLIKTPVREFHRFQQLYFFLPCLLFQVGLDSRVRK